MLQALQPPCLLQLPLRCRRRSGRAGSVGWQRWPGSDTGRADIGGHWQRGGGGGRTVTATGPSATVPAGGRPGWNSASGAAGSCSGSQRLYCRVRTMTCRGGGGGGGSRGSPGAAPAPPGSWRQAQQRPDSRDRRRGCGAGAASASPAVPASVRHGAAEQAGSGGASPAQPSTPAAATHRQPPQGVLLDGEARVDADVAAGHRAGHLQQKEEPGPLSRCRRHLCVAALGRPQRV
jgi:hypothetical protein